MGGSCRWVQCNHRVFIRRMQEGQRQKEMRGWTVEVEVMSFEDREEAMNQRMQMTSRNWER